MEQRIREWEILRCAACETSSSFVALHELRVREGSGMVPSVKGYQCQMCGQVANPGELQQHADIRRREQAIQRQTAELEALKTRSSPGSTS